MLCGWGVKAGIYGLLHLWTNVWMANTTVWSIFNIYIYSYSVFPSTCLGLGYCYCFSLYTLFLIHFTMCIHTTLSRCSLSTWIKVLIDWLHTNNIWAPYRWVPPDKVLHKSRITLLLRWTVVPRLHGPACWATAAAGRPSSADPWVQRPCLRSRPQRCACISSGHQLLQQLSNYNYNNDRLTAFDPGQPG